MEDRRPYVLSREKSPRHVATVRGRYGQPFDAYTASDRPLAVDMLDVLERSLTVQEVSGTSTAERSLTVQNVSGTSTAGTSTAGTSTAGTSTT